MAYNVSTNANTWQNAVQLSSFTGSDPMVTFDRSGNGWVGCVNVTAPTGFRIARKFPGDPYAQPFVLAEFPLQIVGKGLLVAGPPFGGGTDAAGLVFAKDVAGKRLHGLLSPDLGTTWDHTAQFTIGVDPAGNLGGPGNVVAIRNGTLAGRRVVAYRANADGNLPLSTYQFTSTTWLDSVPLSKATDPATGNTNDIGGVLSGLLGPGGATVANFPSLASDPRDEQIMYMVFTAIDPYIDYTNADLMIARSQDGGVDFSGTGPLAGSRVLHLLD